MIRCFALASVPGAIPCRWQVAGKRHQRGAVDVGSKRRGDIVLSDAILQMRDALQRSVPAVLELARYQTLGRVDDLIAAAASETS